MGTVAYLSPEQVATGAADARSDVYAAGVLLYELLTGAPPYTGDTAISVAYRHVNCDVPAAVARSPATCRPSSTSWSCGATRRDPAARPADAAAMLAELRRVAAGWRSRRCRRRCRRAARRSRTRCPAPPPRHRSGTRRVPAARRHPRAAPEDPPWARPRPVDARAAPPARAGAGGAAVGSSRCGSALVAGARAARRRRGVVAGQRALDGDADRRRACEQATAAAAAHAAPTWSRPSRRPRRRRGRGPASRGTDPRSGARLLRGSTVRPDRVAAAVPPVPAIAAGTPVAARRAGDPRRRAHARAVDRRAEYSATVPEGAVMRTDPRAGTAAPARQPGDARGQPRRRATTSGPGAVPRSAGRLRRGDRRRWTTLGLEAEVADAFAVLGARSRRRQVVDQCHGARQHGRPRHDDHPARLADPVRPAGTVSRAASPRPGTPAPGTAGCSAAGRRPSRSGRRGRRRRSPARRRGTR